MYSTETLASVSCGLSMDIHSSKPSRVVPSARYQADSALLRIRDAIASRATSQLSGSVLQPTGLPSASPKPYSTTESTASCATEALPCRHNNHMYS